MQSLASCASWRSHGASSRIPAKVARPVTQSGAERSSSKNGMQGRRPSLPRRPYTNASKALASSAAAGPAAAAAAGGTTTGGGGDAPLEIRIETNKASNTLMITDTGVGMRRAEMASNLGTIARSGSRAFVEEMDQTILAE